MPNLIQRIRTFYLDTVAELKKCTWPTRHELWESTLIVIVSSLLLSVFVFVMDAVVRALVRALT